MGHAAFGVLPLEPVRIKGPPLITLNPTASGHRKQWAKASVLDNST